jgi:cytochrome c peroxidase
MARTPRSLSALIVATAVLALTIPARSQPQLSPLPREVRAPADNPTTPEKVELGRLLFWDPILSGPKDVACATCHHPDFGYAENLDLSIGAHGTGLGANRRFDPTADGLFVKRNSQTVLNTAFNGIDASGGYDPTTAPMFWDVRVTSLEAQALEPLKALEEMRGTTYSEAAALATVVARLQAIPDYRTRFARAFGPRASVSAENLGKALAAFQRTLVAANAPFDRYMRGDTTAMSPLAVRGMQRFQRIGCANCHTGPMFSDFKVHTLGVPDNAKLPATDPGVENRYAFRTPTLRNLAYTAPYMHSGTLQTLDDVIEFYDDVNGGRRGGGRRGGGRTPNPLVARENLDPLVRQLNLGGGRRDLVAFLEALSDPGFDRTIPARVPSGLAVGGKILD